MCGSNTLENSLKFVKLQFFNIRKGKNNWLYIEHYTVLCNVHTCCRKRKDDKAAAADDPAVAFLDSCRQLALVDMEILAITQENQQLSAALSLQEDKSKGLEARLEKLKETEAAERKELQLWEDQRIAWKNSM